MGELPDDLPESDIFDELMRASDFDPDFVNDATIHVAGGSIHDTGVSETLVPFPKRSQPEQTMAQNADATKALTIAGLIASVPLIKYGIDHHWAQSMVEFTWHTFQSTVTRGGI